MKFSILLLLMVYVCSGCMTRQYTVILRNGQKIAASNRPKVAKATAIYHLKDRAGRPVKCRHSPYEKSKYARTRLRLVRQISRDLARRPDDDWVSGVALSARARTRSAS